jgi:hypothetical protein
MTGFSADWLALREPADHRARDADLVARLVAALHCVTKPIVTELACGTGSTLRALAPILPARWRLVDHDPGLLARASRDCAAWDAEILQADLSAGIDSVLDLNADLVSTSAFLDLVSAPWIARLASACAARRLPFYAALSVDGVATASPGDPLDRLVFDAFHRDMTRDKGFGPALGPGATLFCADAFRRQGYAVSLARSDWKIGADERDLQLALVEGWAAAAIMQAEPGRAPDITAWALRRKQAAEAGSLQLLVGHLDLLALPPQVAIEQDIAAQRENPA